MNFGIFLILVNSALCESGDIDEELNASLRTVEFKNGTLVREVTATIIYSMHKTMVNTTIISNGSTTMTETFADRITYIPTILPYLKAIISTPSASPAINTPVATQPFKMFFMNPGILIGCTFGLLFIVGFLYTSCCRKPQSVKRPRAIIVKKRSRFSSSSDSFKKAKTNRNKNKSDQGKDKPRSKTVASHANTSRSGSARRSSARGERRSGRGERRSGRGERRSGRGGTSRGGGRSSTTRGRTSSRM